MKATRMPFRGAVPITARALVHSTWLRLALNTVERIPYYTGCLATSFARVFCARSLYGQR